jgi:hypothetical protein
MGARWITVKHCGGHAFPADERLGGGGGDLAEAGRDLTARLALAQGAIQEIGTWAADQCRVHDTRTTYQSNLPPSEAASAFGEVAARIGEILAKIGGGQ